MNDPTFAMAATTRHTDMEKQGRPLSREQRGLGTHGIPEGAARLGSSVMSQRTLHRSTGRVDDPSSRRLHNPSRVHENDGRRPHRS